MLPPKQRFKIAVLALCADAGLALSETHELVKFACEGLEKRGADDLKTTLLKAPFQAPGWGLTQALRIAALGIPAGALLGYTGAKLTSAIDDETPEEVQNRETIEEFERRTQAAQLSTALRAKRQAGTRRRGRGLI